MLKKFEKEEKINLQNKLTKLALLEDLGVSNMSKIKRSKGFYKLLGKLLFDYRQESKDNNTEAVITKSFTDTSLLGGPASQISSATKSKVYYTPSVSWGVLSTQNLF